MAPPGYAADVKSFAVTKCENCHAPTVRGADRKGADPSLNFETYAKMKATGELAATRVEKGEMPPKNMAVDDLSASEKDVFLQWVYCGMNP